MKRLFQSAVLALTISSLVILPARIASAQTSPEVFNAAASCYRSIVQTDDLFCVNRYYLPASLTSAPVSPESWCQYLADQTGCTGNPPVPESPDSLIVGSAVVNLYDSSALVAQVYPPRIGYSIAGIYLPAGHGITWGDTGVESCVESLGFTTNETSCTGVLWNLAANTEAAQRTQLGDDMLVYLASLEQVDNQVPVAEYVENNKITTAGHTLAIETLNVLDRLIPGYFQTGAVPVIGVGFTPGAGLPLQSDINATAAAFKSDLDSAGTELGIPGDALGILVFTVFGLGAFVAVKRYTDGNNTPLAVVGFLTMMLCGTLVGAVPVAVAAVAALLIAAVGVLFILRKMVFA